MKFILCVFTIFLLVPTCPGSVFDYCIATKGPLDILGNMRLDGVSMAMESNIYIESLADSNSLEIIGSSQIAGEVKIVNPDATVTLLGGLAGIGGEYGLDAIDHHVEFGVPAFVFPYPDTSHFIQYLSGEILTDPYPSGSSYQNITIPAGTNPHFTNDVQLKGIIYIEQPNNVIFSGNVDITGIIVAAGNPADNSATNTIDFQNNITSSSITSLDETFDSDLKNEIGTFIIAPGFKVSIGGAFDQIYGCIASNGIEFYGYAGGTINGSILNYSDEPMLISGFNDFYFNRAGVFSAPAGFNSPVLKVEFPDGGESLISGEEYLIRWLGNINLSDVLIKYSIDNGSNWLNIESPGTENTGLYRWTVPVADSNDCLVRIVSVVYPSISDISDAPFSISPPYTCNAYLPMDFNEDCKVDLIDLTVFMEHWLECHREPIETCN